MTENISHHTAIPSASAAKPVSLDRWVQQARNDFINKLTANISPADGHKGAVIASPSRSNPDYYYHWIRDSARTMGEIVRLQALHPHTHYEKLMEDYVTFSAKNQTTLTPSGHVGEPKFYADGSAFEEEWGRPQNDGPAQRALTLIRWVQTQRQQGKPESVWRALYQDKPNSAGLIKTDLEFIAHHWQDACFDVWEEVEGTHFYTRMLQRVALREGAGLAASLNDTDAADVYHQQADCIELAMAAFWDENKSYYVATLDRVSGLDYKTSGLDVSVILGAFQALSSQSPFLPPVHDRILATAYALYRHFDNEYAVNTLRQTVTGDPVAPAIGRYPEDEYSGTRGVKGGNPWFLCTAAFCSISYQAALLFTREDDIRVTPLNKDMLECALSYSKKELTLTEGETIQHYQQTFSALIKGFREMGDAFLRRIQLYCSKDNTLSEQFHRETGEQLSADNLTWSYVAVVSAIDLRASLCE